MNIVLIGYRGTGKSTVGKILAKRLGRIVVSTDAEVVRQAGCPIPDIVKEHGWEHFRDLESAVCEQVGAQDHLIIDTGGGAMLRSQNLQALKRQGTVVWLTASVSTIAHRIGSGTQRPSLTGTQSFVEEIEAVLAERRPLYQAAADHVIETDRRSSKGVAEAILHILQPLS